jgi:two-component system chemotaxis response regulator CheB
MDMLTSGNSFNILLAANNPENVLSFLSNPANTPDLVFIDNGESPVASSIFREINNKNIPIFAITLSPDEGFKMMQQGAIEFIPRRNMVVGDKFSYQLLVGRVRETLAKFHETANRTARCAGEPLSGKIIAIGSSAGGTEALLTVLKKMPRITPPILIVQHIPPVFSRLYAERLDRLCKVQVWEARNGDKLANGLVLLAPGGQHMTLAQSEDDTYYVRCAEGAPVCNQCPAVDVLFDSVADIAGSGAVGIILTGMGADGAEGLKKMRDKGAFTIGQDQATSTVYGMPRAAFEIGAVCIQMPLEEITKEILANAY